jgi:hypothetical protein
LAIRSAIDALCSALDASGRTNSMPRARRKIRLTRLISLRARMRVLFMSDSLDLDAIALTELAPGFQNDLRAEGWKMPVLYC